MAKYLEQIQSEHLEITKAIETRNAERARTGMRSHLKGSQDRYRRLIARAT
jgi:DNA-binding FadR family transcriptional regulator